MPQVAIPTPPPLAPPGPLEPVVHDTDGLESWPTIQMDADTSFLSAEERQVVNLLNQAGDLMSEIYLRQAFAANPAVRTQIAALAHPQQPALIEKFDAFFGPWDPIDDDKPFFGNLARPEGAGFYPRRPDQSGIRRLSCRQSGRSRRADRAPIPSSAARDRGSSQSLIRLNIANGSNPPRGCSSRLGDHQQCHR